jgi:hypothetical protein
LRSRNKNVPMPVGGARTASPERSMNDDATQYGYGTRPPRDFGAQRVMVCQSEIDAYAAKYPGLGADKVREILLAYGPSRKDVEEHLDAASRDTPSR